MRVLIILLCVALALVAQILMPIAGGGGIVIPPMLIDLPAVKSDGSANNFYAAPDTVNYIQNQAWLTPRANLTHPGAVEYNATTGASSNPYGASAGTIALDATGPFPTNFYSGITFTEDSAAATHGMYCAGIGPGGANWVATYYVKPGTRQVVFFRATIASVLKYHYYDLSDNSSSGTGGATITVGSADANGWRLVTVTSTAPSTLTGPFVGMTTAKGTSSWAGDGASTFSLSGWQVSSGTTPTTFEASPYGDFLSSAQAAYWAGFEFSTITNTYLQGQPFSERNWPGGLAGDWSILMLGRWKTPTAAKYAVSVGDYRNTNNSVGIVYVAPLVGGNGATPSSSTIQIQQNSGGVTTNSSSLSLNANGRAIPVLLARSGNTYTMTRTDTGVAVTLAADITGIPRILVGALADSSRGASSTTNSVPWLAVWTRAISVAQANAAVARYKTRFRQIVYVLGDSIAAGSSATAGFGWANQMVSQTDQSYLAANTMVTNTAISAQTSAQLAANISTELVRDRAYGTEAAAIGIGSNDLAAGVAPATIKTNIDGVVSYLRGLTPAITRIVVATVLPRCDAGLPADFVTQLDALNTLIKNGAGESTYQVADVQSNAALGSTAPLACNTANQCAGTNCYAVDLIHPTTAGHKVYAAYAADALKVAGLQ